MAEEILNHVIKLIIYSQEKNMLYQSGKAANELIRHWEDIIFAFMQPANVKLKGGGFSYNWFFDPYTPYDKRQIDIIVDSIIQSSEKGLTPRVVSALDIIDILYNFRDGLALIHKQIKNTLTKEEVLVILRNTLNSHL
jgi:hypothetical protein